MARKSTTGKSTPQPSPLSGVLEKLVIPAIMAEQEPGDDGSSINRPDPDSEDHPCVRGLLRGGWMVHARPLPIDETHTLLRLSLLSGYIISDCPSAVILLGNLLEPTPFQIRTHYQLGLIGEICIGCDLTVRTDDAPLVQRRITELRQLADDLDGLLPLRVPHHLNWRCVRGLEIDWLDLPHQDLGGFLDEGMEAPRSERTPLTLLRLAQGLERWQDVLRLLREHADELPARDYAPLKCLACHELQRWLPAIRAAKAGVRALVWRALIHRRGSDIEVVKAFDGRIEEHRGRKAGNSRTEKCKGSSICGVSMRFVQLLESILSKRKVRGGLRDLY